MRTLGADRLSNCCRAISFAMITQPERSVIKAGFGSGSTRSSSRDASAQARPGRCNRLKCTLVAQISKTKERLNIAAESVLNNKNLTPNRSLNAVAHTRKTSGITAKPKGTARVFSQNEVLIIVKVHQKYFLAIIHIDKPLTTINIDTLRGIFNRLKLS